MFLFPIASSKCDHEYKIIFNTIQDGSFWGLSRKVCQKGFLPKSCHTYLKMMKLATVIPYLKKITKINELRETNLLSDISIFAQKISKFCYIKKYRYSLYFDT